MRTDDEILQRIKDIATEEVFGFVTTDLVGFLPFAKVRAFLKPQAREEDWHPLPRDHESIKNQIHGYMAFAWGKANNCRGLSAGRSINHMQAWL